MLTEQDIELRVEKSMDKIDTMLLNGRISEATYDQEVRTLDLWAKQQYSIMKGQHEY